MGVEPPKNGIKALLRRAMRERISLPAVWVCHKKPAVGRQAAGLTGHQVRQLPDLGQSSLQNHET